MVIAVAFSTLLTGLAAAALAQSQGGRTSSPCESQLSDAGTTAGNLTLPNGSPFDVNRAMALFRFNRKKDALRELDSAVSIVSGPWRWRINPERLKQLKASLNALRNCVARSEPPAMATLSIEAFLVDPDVGEHARQPVAGATIKVEEIPVGRTADDGTLTVRVPSGPIHVTAELAPTTAGRTDLTVLPGASERLALPMDPEKEVGEDTDLVLAEAVDDIVPVRSRSFTLKFMRGDEPAPIDSIGSIDLVDRHENFERNLDELFAIADGSIVARSAAKVLESLVAHSEQTVALQVTAEDADGGMHHGLVRFRLGLSRLSVTLLPPPSNPALPVSNIAIGVSLIGAGIAVQRVSDREGRFEIDALPHGTIGLDCETVSGGLYYYCGGIMPHWGDQSVILVPLHVSDRRAGVPPLTLQPNAAAAPHVERRKPGQ
jgi:hypothetical protein